VGGWLLRRDRDGVRGAAVRHRLRQQEGFTLPEALVAMVVMAAVLFALYALFDASVRVFGAGHDRLRTVEDARLGLARMEREIRAAYPLDRANGNGVLLSSFGENHITLGNDLNGNRRILNPNTGAPDPKERISYASNGGGLPVRNGIRLVRFAGDVDGDGRALTFEYFDAYGNPVTSGEQADVALVRVKLEMSIDSAGGEPVTRVLRTAVALRNRGL
jgi:prepilin-type N-terminal cleavage/methylation domain-containing protein